MTEAAAAITVGRSEGKLRLTVRTLTASLLALFGADNLLLLHFWGLPLPATVALIFVAASLIWLLCRKISDEFPAVPWQAFGIALVVSIALFALGGEGRFFYANTDWQIRDAVLHDMATSPWPYAYDIGGTAYFLRAPLGMYLLPAMFGANADLALLLLNSLRFALLLTLGWQLFHATRDRVIALAVFILFSGWDIVGTAIYSALGGHRSWDHIEPWDLGLQYSSHVTQAFWVPQHAIAGWTCALVFLLWRRGFVPIGIFAAAIPLVAIWSPLAIMGAVPFAALAGVEVLRRRSFDAHDIFLAAVALAVAIPALVYLQIAAESVSKHLLLMNPLVWALCIVLEVLPFAWPLLRNRGATIDRPVVWLTTLLLLVMPLVQIGVSTDFQMRASIMPLALLAILFAEWISGHSGSCVPRGGALTYALIAVTLGAVTPLLEIRRAVVDGPSPPPLCSLVGVWNQMDNMLVPYSTYLVPVAELPARYRDLPVVAGRADPPRCWDRPWALPQGWRSRSAN